MAVFLTVGMKKKTRISWLESLSMGPVWFLPWDAAPQLQPRRNCGVKFGRRNCGRL
jgi:hypothetical protein